MLAKPVLVFSSYALLFALLAIRVNDWTLKSFLIGFALLGLISLWGMFALDARSARVEREVVSVQGPGPEAGGYLVSYLLPFVISPDPAVVDLVAYGIFLLVAGVITASTGAIQVNPILYMLFFKIVKVTDSGGLSNYVVVRQVPIAGQKISVTQLRPDVWVMRRDPDPQPETSR